MVFKNAVPSAPPTCCVVLTSALATRAFSSSTPNKAALFMGTNIDLDATGEASSDEEVIFIKVRTVSGDIRIDKAS